MRGCAPLLVALLALGLFLPGIIFLVLGAAVVFFLAFVPLGFAAQSLFWIASGPSQLYGILINPRVRRNHALEHATLHVLEETYGPLNLSGLAFEKGFTVRGDLFDGAAGLIHRHRLQVRVGGVRKRHHNSWLSGFSPAPAHRHAGAAGARIAFLLAGIFHAPHEIPAGRSAGILPA